MVEFPLEREDVELCGDGRIDLDGLLGDSLPFGLGQVVQSTQIMEPVGEFYDEYAQTPARAQENLAVCEVLERGPVEIVSRQLGTPINQLCNHHTEPVLYVVEGDRRNVLNHIMEESGCKQVGVSESQFPDENLGYGTGMTDIGRARSSTLTFMELVRKLDGMEKNMVLLIPVIQELGYAGTIVFQIKEMGFAPCC